MYFLGIGVENSDLEIAGLDSGSELISGEVLTSDSGTLFKHYQGMGSRNQNGRMRSRAAGTAREFVRGKKIIE